MIFCTISCTNHVAKSIVMAKSLKKQMPNIKVILCLVEEMVPNFLEDCTSFDQVILAKDLEIPNFYSFIFRSNIYEATCSLKGYLLKYLLKHYPVEIKFTYIDSDTKVYSPLNEINELLENEAIIVTPHHLEPYQQLEDIIKIERHQLRAGVFNAGFFAIKRGMGTDKFLNWWNERLKHFCYIDFDEGLFLDQKWLDLAPGFFNVYILKHPGYNVGNWNIANRRMTRKNRRYYCLEMELKFFHFSGLHDWLPKYMKEFYPNPEEAIYQLRNSYVKQLKENGDRELQNVPWSYDYFHNGEKITAETRKNFRQRSENHTLENPFQTNNQAFWGE